MYGWYDLDKSIFDELRDETAFEDIERVEKFVHKPSNLSNTELISNKSSVNLLRLFRIRCLRTYL
jgi:hypothetical protein